MTTTLPLQRIRNLHSNGARDHEIASVLGLKTAQVRQVLEGKPTPATVQNSTRKTTRKKETVPMPRILNEATDLYKKLIPLLDTYEKEFPKLKERFVGDELADRSAKLREPFEAIAAEIEAWSAAQPDRLTQALTDARTPKVSESVNEGIYAELRSSRHWPAVQAAIDRAETSAAQLVALPGILNSIPAEDYKLVADQIKNYTQALGWNMRTVNEQLDNRRREVDPVFARAAEEQEQFAEVRRVLPGHARAAREIAARPSEVHSQAVSQIRIWEISAA